MVRQAVEATWAMALHRNIGAQRHLLRDQVGVCTENLSSGVVVMKPAEDGVWSDASDSLNLASDRRILVEGSMGSNAITIVGVGFQDPAQMHLAQNNHVVHTTPDRSISRSTSPFCQGEAGAIGLSRIRVVKKFERWTNL
jgi:hypothetical protein